MWACLENQPPTNASFPLILALSVTSTVYALIFIPLGLTFNLLVLAANFRQQASMKMPDIYFSNMALASLVLNSVAIGRLLSCDWALRGEVCLGFFVLFNVSSPAFIYSSTLLGLDYFIELTLSYTHLSSAYKMCRVCEFIWGGSALASLSSLLSYACAKIADSTQKCAKLHPRELGNAILFFVGFLIPGAAVLYSLVLIYHLRKDPQPFLNPQPYLWCLLLVTVPLTFLLWLPYHGSLFLDLVESLGPWEWVTDPGTLTYIKKASEILAYSCSWAIALLYLTLRKSFRVRCRRVLSEAGCYFKRVLGD
ncbi:UNVERIFIED_CONTAM: hypothetical protein FKN15_020514 [Acipenser sinensis]